MRDLGNNIHFVGKPNWSSIKQPGFFWVKICNIFFRKKIEIAIIRTQVAETKLD
jgi:hypothetical protein